ncbi:uncharacterized protein AB9X84_012004 [Acanthopagrus schlegelii]
MNIVEAPAATTTGGFDVCNEHCCGMKHIYHIYARREVTEHEMDKGQLTWDVSAQAGCVDCGVFMLMYTLYMALDWTFDFTQHYMPRIRRWWCQLLLDNIEPQRKTKCVDMDEQERKRRRMEPMSHGREQEQATCIDQLPSCLLEVIFI